MNWAVRRKLGTVNRRNGFFTDNELKCFTCNRSYTSEKMNNIISVVMYFLEIFTVYIANIVMTYSNVSATKGIFYNLRAFRAFSDIIERLCFHSVTELLNKAFIGFRLPFTFVSDEIFLFFLISNFQALPPPQTYYVRLEPRLCSRVASETHCLC